MAIQIIWENEGVVCKGSGTVSGEEIIGIGEKISGDSRFDTLRYQIIDLLDVASIDPLKADDAIRKVQIIAAYDKAASLSNPNIRVAIVTTDETIVALATLYDFETLESPWESKTFNTLKAADVWLNNDMSNRN